MNKDNNLTVNGESGYELIYLSEHDYGEEVFHSVTYRHKKTKKVRTSLGYYNSKENSFEF